MRVDFCNAVSKILADDPNSFLLTGDLGYNAFEEIASKYPDRFLNAGVAEQNMVGVACGFALSGLQPWVYSITPFITLRVLEQIRNDACLHNLPVRFVGNGGGYTYGIMGSTHHALEELGALKGLPNMRLFFPCANDQVGLAVREMHCIEGPAYLRLSLSAYNTAQKPLSENPKTLTRQYKKGSLFTIIGIGHAVQIALAAAEKFGEKINADVFGIARFPLDLNSDRPLLDSVEKSRKVLIIDEHYEAGSIAESLRSVLRGADKCQIMSARYFKSQLYGSSKFHLEQCGLTPDRILEQLENSV